MSVQGRRVLLVVGGGIAAYKALELIRLIRRAGGGVTCILTRSAKEFVTPLSLASLSGARVFDDLFSLTDEAEMGHIELSRSADLVVVAPATADLMARVATGNAGDLASTALLATDKRVLFAPSMNVRMWLHPATLRNVARLRADGAAFVGPDDGAMACGEFGPGRMAEPAAILDAIEAALARGDTLLPLPTPAPIAGRLAGRRILVTSGPTREPIDPVRFLSNHSSGRQGHAIAAAAADEGARVVLVTGPVAVADPAGVEVVRVETAREMLAAVESALPADAAVFCAAVADWRVEGAAPDKLKKAPGAGPPALQLIENPDILATVARRTEGRPHLVVGFAAETRDVVGQAQAKRLRKSCDWIVANDVSPGSGVFGGTSNAVHLVTAGGVEGWPTLPKGEVARRLVQRIADALASAE